MSFSNNSSINFPRGTITPKLSSKLLKKPPSPKDWMHQTYAQMIQDVNYAASHYYESSENGKGLLGASTTRNGMALESAQLSETNKKSATLGDSYETSDYANSINADLHSPFSKKSPINHKSTTNTPLSVSEYQHNTSNSDNDIEEEGDDDDDDDESEVCNTYTTSSTDCNRRNNIYRFYREQQSLTRPIEEEGVAIIKTVTPRSSGKEEDDNDNISNNSGSNKSRSKLSLFIHSIGSCRSIGSQYKNDINVNQQQKQQYNKGKKIKLLKSMMTKMRIAAEKPFWAIDRHFYL